MKDYRFDEMEEAERDADVKTVTEETSEEKKENGKDAKGEKSGGLAAEERKTGIVKLETITSYFKAGGGTTFITLIILSCLTFTVASISTQLTLSWWSVNRFGWDTKQYLGLYGGLGGFTAVAMIAINIVVCIGGYKAAINFHTAAVKGILYAPMSFFDSQPVGRIINRFSVDVRALDIGFVGTLISVFLYCVQVVAAVVIVSVSNPVLVVQFALLGIIYYTLFRYYQSSYRELKRLSSILKSPHLSHVSESLTGIPTITAYNTTPSFISAQQTKLDQRNVFTVLLGTTRVWLQLRLQLMSSTVVLVLVLMAPLKLVETGTVAISLTYAVSLSALIINALLAVGTIEASVS
ncbi:hypothetical protein HK102_010552 [Quaeritorhiza haematococci]|nr:hypothetical protein HK102_010552 [Quaeritorhiza haematococci]